MAIRIDLTSGKNRAQLHAVVADALGFPDHYGMNWDVFDECMRGFRPKDSIEVVAQREFLYLCQKRKASSANV